MGGGPQRRPPGTRVWVGSLCLPMACLWTQGRPWADLHEHPCQGCSRGRDLATRGVGEWRERPTGVRRPVLQLPAGVRAKGAHGAFKATAAASACIAAVFLDAVPRFTCALLCAHRACAQHPPSCGFPPSAGCPPSSGFSPSITAHPLPTPHPACSRTGPGKPQDRHPVQDEGAPRTDAVAPPPARRTAHRSAYSGGPPRGQLLLPAPPRRGAVAWDELHDGVGCVWRRRSTLEP